MWPPYLSQFAVYKTLLENTFELKYAKNSPASVFYTSLESQKWNKKKKAAILVVGAQGCLKAKERNLDFFMAVVAWGGPPGSSSMVKGQI